ncbi:polysaccharide deacetylase family protein [Streptomyces paludis]|uniref:Polysaccharide deacetylase n=1 Tax=Streptomyces paludis TaxID=2282738 RepID=A0A345HW89_9ACTN|nr:polysaccharide deacetylase family protein [Streptomyces paludis]AXG80963.1 polysaccharide deacetylase [Streptomyces paludis]
MTRYVRVCTAVALLGAALAGCGDGRPAPASAASAPTSASASPAPAGSTPASGSPAVKGPPTLAPGADGLTPVFVRGAKAAGKTVALTFDADMTADQGPRAAEGERFDNPSLIALLRRLDVPSTVFMTGRWAEEYPTQAKAIGTDPLFEIANHSYSHYAFTADCYGLPVVGKERMADDVRRAFAAFKTAGARNVVPYFRFPGGCYDDTARRALAPAGVTAVQWDVVSGDAFATDADAVAAQVLAGVRPGSLVVMHCTRSAAPVTEDAVRQIVPELRKRGYRFVKVSELMKP